MAKEAMQAVSRAEEAALETVQQAKEEADRLRREAAAQGEQLVAAAVKEARKRADVLCGVARADGKKRQETLLQESRKEQEQLREQAAARQGQVAGSWNGWCWASPEGGESVAIVAMKRLELYGLQRERKALLELLQRRGMVEIHSPQRTEPLFSPGGHLPGTAGMGTECQPAGGCRRPAGPVLSAQEGGFVLPTGTSCDLFPAV